MKKSESIEWSSQVYYRLIALWVVCEALLGGIIHGMKLPVSGLIVGSSAVICICLIAFYVPVRGAILKATIIVAIFKMMLSPHSPLPAYFAVLFQGLIGELFFFNRKYYRFASVCFAVIALMESAVQRILVMTIIYGNNIWTAINEFVKGFTKNDVNYSYWFIGFYLMCHLIIGLLVGWFAANLPRRTKTWNSKDYLFTIQNPEPASNRKRTGKGRIVFVIVWFLLIALFLQSYFSIGEPLMPSGTVSQILFRSAFILLSWYLIISPILTNFLRSWLLKKQKASQNVIEEITVLLPSTRYIVMRSWQLSSELKGLRRLPKFCKLVLTNTLHNA